MRRQPLLPAAARTVRALPRRRPTDRATRFCASSSARITGMRSWIAAATRLDAESQVSSVMLCSHSPSTFAGVHSEAKANGAPPSTLKWNGWRELAAPLRFEPLVVAVGELQSAARGARDQTPVGRLLGDGLHARVDHQRALDLGRPRGHEPPAHQLSAPVRRRCGIQHHRQHLFGRRDVVAVRALGARRSGRGSDR